MCKRISDYLPEYWPDEAPTASLPVPCPECGGDKGFEVFWSYDPRDGSPRGYFDRCRFCGGTGEVESEPIDIEDLDEMDDPS